MPSEVKVTEKKLLDLHVDEAPGYPEDLKLHPKDYTIYLPSDQWHPLEKAAEQNNQSNP